jgi:predicted dehydrogenase
LSNENGAKSINVGLIGCGGIANLHLRVFKSMKNVNVVGVCDLNLDRAKETAAKFKVEKAFKDYNDLFEMKDLGLVDICTPISTHARIACDAAKNVPAILVEKPMARSVAECDEVISTLKKYGSKLCISHQQIFLPSVEKAKAMLETSGFDLVSFTTRQKESFELLKAHKLAADWMVAPEQGGILWEVCTHLAYLQLHFLGDIKEVYAVGRKVKYPVYDNFAVLLKASEERYGLIDLSWTSKETEIVYEVCDTGGRKYQAYRDFDYFVENKTYPPLSASGVSQGFFSDEKRVLQKWAKFGVNYAKQRKMIPHFKLISTYLSNIEKGLPPPVTPEDGRKTINLLEHIKKSLDENRPVSMNS